MKIALCVTFRGQMAFDMIYQLRLTTRVTRIVLLSQSMVRPFTLRRLYVIVSSLYLLELIQIFHSAERNT